MFRGVGVLTALGLSATLLVGGATPAQAASSQWGGCNVTVTPMQAGLYRMEKFCRISSVFDIRTKTDESYFFIPPKLALV